jgi:hypothetical protein
VDDLASLQPAGDILYEGVAAERDRTSAVNTRQALSRMSAIGPKRTFRLRCQKNLDQCELRLAGLPLDQPKFGS